MSKCVALVITVNSASYLTLRNVLQIFGLLSTTHTHTHKSRLHQRRRGGPEAVLDAVKDCEYPHTTCSALSLSWKREDNVLSHPPTLPPLYTAACL